MNGVRFLKPIHGNTGSKTKNQAGCCSLYIKEFKFLSFTTSSSRSHTIRQQSRNIFRIHSKDHRHPAADIISLVSTCLIYPYTVMHQELSAYHERHIVPTETGFKQKEWSLCPDQPGLLVYIFMFDSYIAVSTSVAIILYFLHSRYNGMFCIPYLLA